MMQKMTDEKELITTVGVSLSLLAIIGYIFLNKSIGALNKLLYQLQFFAYMSLWMIGTTKLIKYWLMEIKLVVLQEYFDDVDFFQEVMTELGIEGKNESMMENTDNSRLGSSNLLTNLGPTLLILISVTMAIILLILLATFIIKRTGYTGKVKQRINQIK